MGGVYGDFLEYFSELYEPFNVWTLPDKSDMRKVVAVHITSGGSSMKRRKYTSGNTAHDIVDTDQFYISRKYDSTVKIGDYIQKINDNIIMRLTALLPYDKAAGYRIYTIERVTGTTVDDTEDLHVKEATFA